MTLFDIDCPECMSSNTSVVLETAYERVCEDCDEHFDIRPPELIEEDRLYAFVK